jgi:hypothetical protein
MGSIIVIGFTVALSLTAMAGGRTCESVLPVSFNPIDSFDATKSGTPITMRISTDCSAPKSGKCSSLLGETKTDYAVPLCSSLTSLELADLIRKADRLGTKCGAHVEQYNNGDVQITTVLTRKKVSTSDPEQRNRPDFFTMFQVCKEDGGTPCINGVALIDPNGGAQVPNFRAPYASTEKTNTAKATFQPAK